MTHQKILFSLIFILLLILFTIHGYTTLDPDFGWHLKMGQVILTSGIPKTDPFSYTMPSYPFIDHEWLTNVIFYIGYSLVGKFGLSLIFAALAIIALVIPVSKKGYNFLPAPFLLSATIILPFIGIKPQIESWVLLAIFLKTLTSQKIFEKWRFFLPILFIVWANLHGGFAAGIVILLLFYLVNIWEKKRFQLANLAVFSLSVCATFINPYGIKIWQEIWVQIGDNNLRWSILEWQPMLFSINFAFSMLLALSLVLIFRYRKRFNLFEKLLYLGLLFAGLSSLRHTPLWLIATIPLVTKSLELTLQEFSKDKLANQRLMKLNNILVTSVVVISFLTITWTFQSTVVKEDFYPRKAVTFLKTLPGSGQIFAPYDWGGFLIWNLEDRKVFIDGRMPSWREQSSNTKESGWAFKEYMDATSGDAKTLERIFKKYNVGYALWRKSGKEGKELTAQLKKLAWKEIYQDSVATVYQRPD